jgi:hypothetical protein
MSILGCGRNKQKIIPEKKMVAILTDYYIMNGVITDYSVSRKMNHLDSASVYGSVLTKYGYIKADFDASLKYYINQPEKIEELYQKVIDELIKREAEMKAKDESLVTKSVIWEDKKKYQLPKDGKKNKIEFSIPISDLGTYTFSSKILMYSDDESLNPKITVYFWYDNNSKLGNRYYFPNVNIKKNNNVESYTTTAKLKNKKFTHIKGSILDDNNGIKEEYSKHAIVEKSIIHLKK